MTDNTLTDKIAGAVVDETWPNNIHTALRGDFMGRGPTGVPTEDQNLGTQLLPWGQAFIGSLIVDEVLIDFGTAEQFPNRIVSSASRSTSDQPDFIRADGATNEFDLLATTTNLVITVNGSPATFTADATVTSITLAPSSNNTCLVDDTTLTDQESSKHIGEDGTTLTIDAAGTEITDRIGQYATFKHGTTGFFFAFIESATELTNIYRGFFIEWTDAPLVRQVLSDDDVLTLMSTGWVFAQNNGTTLDVTYVEPIADFVEPSGPATGDYWLDLNTVEWKRFSGSAFVVINRIPIGLVVTDTANTVASRSFDLSKIFSDYNTIDLEKESDSLIKSIEAQNRISVYGSTINYDFSHVRWDFATDIESGVEASNQIYYLYVTQDGESIISIEKPYQRQDLKGQYHPYNTWRSVGNVFNDGSSNFEDPFPVDPNAKVEVFDSSGTWLKPGGFPSTSLVLIECWGAGAAGGRDSSGNAGGGGGGSYKHVWKQLSELSDSETVTIGAGGAGLIGDGDGNNGGSSSFGSHLTAFGGTGGASGGTGGASGGYASTASAGTQNNDTGGDGYGGHASTNGDVPHAGYNVGGGGGGTVGINIDGAPSVYGGGGGGSNSGSGGASQFAGDGGAGSNGGGTSGSAPSGGGGGTRTGTSGSGGNGRVVVTIFG